MLRVRKSERERGHRGLGSELLLRLHVRLVVVVRNVLLLSRVWFDSVFVRQKCIRHMSLRTPGLRFRVGFERNSVVLLFAPRVRHFGREI